MLLHLDGDSFFASCEVALNPALRGKPVITGLEKGIASSMSYEAKRRGVTRAMPLFEIRKICPDAIIVPSNFDTYVTFSRRMFTIVRRYCDEVEEYSIDECFADLMKYGDDPEVLLEIGRKIKKDIVAELGITVSLGISRTKVLAKVASKWHKPDGLTYITPDQLDVFLEKIPVGKVWGIGASTSVRLNKLKVFTALEFVRKSQAWVEEYLAKPYLEIWYELRGVPVLSIHNGSNAKHKSISKTQMFKPPSADPAFIFAELSKNIENACSKARACKIAPKEMSMYLKTQQFRYYSYSVHLGKPTNIAHELVTTARQCFKHMYRPNTLFRATGVTLYGMSGLDLVQTDLFNGHTKAASMDQLYTDLDAIDARYGKHTLFLASSLQALSVKESKKRTKKLLPLPCMGEVF